MTDLDRFSQGLPDPQDAKVIAYCPGCTEEIYKGTEVNRVEGYLFHNMSCYGEYIGAVIIHAGE